jgi:hypothetical protein
VHRPHLLVPPLAVLLLLAGCTATPTVDEEALADWRSAQEAATETDPDVLGVLTADIQPGDEDPSEVGTGVTLRFPAAKAIDHLEFSCFGNGHMRGIVRIESRGGSGDFTVDPVACRDSPNPIRLTRLASTDVDSVAFNGFDSDRSSAWRLVIVGTAPSGG